MKKKTISSSPSIAPQAIQAYFSHSYRAEDRSVNLFFWELFSAESFFFTVDPQSEKFIVPHLERMMRYSDCFIAVVTRRLEMIHNIGEVKLPKPQSVWTYSRYIAFENYLAELADKPRLVYIESGLDANLFGGHENVHIFERATLNKRKKQALDEVHDFAIRVRAYTGYREHILKPTGKAGILIETDQTSGNYTPETTSDIQQALYVGGYSAEVISPRITKAQSFNRKLSDLELIVAEVRSPYMTPEALAFIQAKALPCIRITKLATNESKADVILPGLLKDYEVGDIEPVITWKKKDDLILEILLYLSKFQQTRKLLGTFEQGKRYFLSAGRKPAKIFISNPHSLNSLALALVEGFQTVNIQFFQYQSSMRIGSAWQDELKKELQDFNVFVALINDDYHSSEWCQLELRTAFERWKSKEVEVLPYIVGKARLPELIKEHIQCAFLRDLSNVEIVDQIVSTLDEYLTNKEQMLKGDGHELFRKEIYGNGNRWAVLAGANQYEDSTHYPPLQVCVKDALALRDQLIKSVYSAQRIRSLTDESEKIPTRDNILVALKSIANATEPDDLLMFYFSGHGVEKDGESYLVANNGRHLLIEETAVPVAKVKEIMRSAAAKAKVIIIDACHSGANLEGKGPATMTDEFIHSVFEEAKGLAILASCEQGQFSYEWHQDERSVFTHYLLEALQGEADFDNKGFVTVQDANRYIVHGVNLWASQHDMSQTPTLQYEVAGDISLVRLE